MKSTAPVIEVVGLRVERDAPILRRIDWRVLNGQNWAIVGANGSGKTSLLRALTGYLPPTAGEIRVLGETYGRFDWRDLRKRIGIVSSSLNQMMPDNETALRAVASGTNAQLGYWGPMSQRDRRAALAILVRVEAREIRDRPWAVLSQGERQRVLIGRALMAKPRLLILDEPCAGLDPAAREHFMDFISRLARTGFGRRSAAPPIVLVTHHAEEIVPIFSHVLVLKGGRVLAQGPCDRILNSATMTAAFGTAVTVKRDRTGRYSLTVRPRRRLVI
ncbi:MAG TPA: ATP-binding cassette domain-containing protein [Candidatus Binataceae bacterium]|nr:ATP-binding cassette domain-containing protein [Candidatus Binataceae bacterium]